MALVYSTLIDEMRDNIQNELGMEDLDLDVGIGQNSILQRVT